LKLGSDFFIASHLIRGKSQPGWNAQWCWAVWIVISFELPRTCTASPWDGFVYCYTRFFAAVRGARPALATGASCDENAGGSFRRGDCLRACRALRRTYSHVALRHRPQSSPAPRWPERSRSRTLDTHFAAVSLCPSLSGPNAPCQACRKGNAPLSRVPVGCGRLAPLVICSR